MMHWGLGVRCGVAHMSSARLEVRGGCCCYYYAGLFRHAAGHGAGRWMGFQSSHGLRLTQMSRRAILVSLLATGVQRCLLWTVPGAIALQLQAPTLLLCVQVKGHRALVVEETGPCFAAQSSRQDLRPALQRCQARLSISKLRVKP